MRSLAEIKDTLKSNKLRLTDVILPISCTKGVTC